MPAEAPLHVLVIGGGIAGLSAALGAEAAGHRVTLIAKGPDSQGTNSAWAQGGIVYDGPGDSSDLRFRDITEAAAGLALPRAARIVADEGPEAVRELLLDLARVPFDRRDGGFDLTQEAAHSVPRILHVHDNTGKVIIQALTAEAARRKRLTVLYETLAVELITRPHHSRDELAVYERPVCLGAYVQKKADAKVRPLFADRVILATGGIGRVYEQSTNPPEATGDGIALALRAGARIVNMEYTQFHPTTLAVPGAKNSLISEAVRGEGGVLLDDEGKDFTRQYDPRGSMAPRDVVSRAIKRHLEKTGRPHVWLSLEKIRDAKRRFPGLFSLCRGFKLDPAREAVPVTPAFHFSCGGVLTDENGLTTLPNLYAVGEVACTGLHGANRLASTSLLEGLVFARRAVRHLPVSDFRCKSFTTEIRPWTDRGLTADFDPILLRQDWETLASTMWNYVGILRTPERLQRARETLVDLRNQVDHFYWRVKAGREMIELRNAIQTALLIAQSASKNPRSVGCHHLTAT